ncbi:MAG: UDP-N-acetylglucosamine 1-carboxyvinyltransferase [Deltaproteobacteria bacterium]|nr:UDP-N-acetylglucosamine 1-carboxyvinyltransferase [Deltaproteobacteria bacterium]
MNAIVIKGGKRLEGSVDISGAKNAALPILASTLLTSGTSVLTNVPRLEDVSTMIRLLEYMGAECRWHDSLIVDSTRLKNSEAPYELVKTMRASILVLGPLVARYGYARVSLPGGCAIGARPINLHLKALETLGARIELEHGYVTAHCDRLRGGEISFDTVTVTGTENILMAACLADGVTTIDNAAEEPEVVALAETLSRMGGRISGAGTRRIVVEGVPRLSPVASRIMPDRIEAGTMMVAAAITGGDVRIRGARQEHLGAVVTKLEEVGVKIEPEGDVLRVIGPERIGSADLRTHPFPGFPTDMQAQFMALMTISEGDSRISETVFENRFMHVNELQRMGADISIQSNTAHIRGVPHLSGAPVMATDLRASASLILAGLAARGETRVTRIYHLDRGYEQLERKLTDLGASVRRVSEE